MEDSVERRPRRPRRATLPSIIGPTPESLVDSGYHENRQSFYNGQKIDPSDIGFAVTSGSNPKRRSRSVDAFPRALDFDRVSPIQWPEQRRRSDDIRYWRNSVGPAPVSENKKEYGEGNDADHETFEVAGDTAPVSFFENDDDVQGETSSEHERFEGDTRDTFDFGIFASTIQQEENLPIEERMVTVEVKLMDLEYAISKIQANAAASKAATSSHTVAEAPTPPASSFNGISNLATPGRQSPVSTHKSHLDSTSTNYSSSVSTQPTAFSITSPQPRSQPDDPFVDNKTRPASQAPTVRYNPVTPMPSKRDYATSEPRSRPGLSGPSVDHFAALISLIRTEQAARQRLESQVIELQREVKLLRQQQQPQLHIQPQHRYQTSHPSLHSSKSMASFSRPRAWTGDKRGEAAPFTDFSLPRRMQSYDAATVSTDDGYQDVYETPIEQRRGEFEGGAINGVEGEAF